LLLLENVTSDRNPLRFLTAVWSEYNG